MDAGTITSIIVAATGLIGAGTAYALGKRGQHNDERQQTAANKLQERIAAFDELEAINDRLGGENSRHVAEIARLRNLITEAEATGNLRLSQQAHRCRDRLDELVAALASLQAVVVSEVARAAAQDAAENAHQHVITDHHEPDA